MRSVSGYTANSSSGNRRSANRSLKNLSVVIPEAAERLSGIHKQVLKLQKNGSMDSGLRPIGRTRNDRRAFFNDPLADAGERRHRQPENAVGRDVAHALVVAHPACRLVAWSA
jgi:hypothetical protein